MVHNLLLVPNPNLTRMAKRYYDKLFREYALADLTRYKEGKVGLRWRTEREVVEGKVSGEGRLIRFDDGHWCWHGR